MVALSWLSKKQIVKIKRNSENFTVSTGILETTFFLNVVENLTSPTLLKFIFKGIQQNAL